MHAVFQSTGLDIAPPEIPQIGLNQDSRFDAILKSLNLGNQLTVKDLSIATQLISSQKQEIEKLKEKINFYKLTLIEIDQQITASAAESKDVQSNSEALKQDHAKLIEEIRQYKENSEKKLERAEKEQAKIQKAYDDLQQTTIHMQDDVELLRQNVNTLHNQAGNRLNRLVQATTFLVEEPTQNFLTIIQSKLSWGPLEKENPLTAFHQSLTPVVKGCNESELGTLATALLPFCKGIVVDRWIWKKWREIDQVDPAFSQFFECLLDCLYLEHIDNMGGFKLAHYVMELLAGRKIEKENTPWKDKAIRWKLEDVPELDYPSFQKSLIPAIEGFDPSKLRALAKAFRYLIQDKDWMLFRGMWKVQQVDSTCAQFFDAVWLELKDPPTIQAKFSWLLNSRPLDQTDRQGMYAQIQRLIDANENITIAQAAIRGYFESRYFQSIGFNAFLTHFQNLQLQSWKAISTWVSEVENCEQKLQMYSVVRTLSTNEIDESATALANQFDLRILLPAYSKQRKGNQTLTIMSTALNLKDSSGEILSLCARMTELVNNS